MKRMKFEGEIAFKARGKELRFCTRPELDCVWSVSRAELVIAEELGGRSTDDIPPYEGNICNCQSEFEQAVDGARMVGCDRI